MKNIYRLLLFLALSLTCFNSFAFGDSPEGSFLVRPWAVGQSITLKNSLINDGTLLGSETITYSVVDAETIDGKDYFWIEVDRKKSEDVDVVEKIQVRKPQAIDFENVLVGYNDLLNPRRRIKSITLSGSKLLGSTNEFEVSEEAVSRIENSPPPLKTENLEKDFKVTANDSVNVPAGTFSASRFRRVLTSDDGTVSQISDDWGSPVIPFLGIVKRVSRVVGLDKKVFEQRTELVSFSNSGAMGKIKKTARTISLEKQKESSDEFLNHQSLSSQQEQP